MGKVHDEIGERLAGFIARQRMFFVSTAPRSDEGLVNLSPKGLDSFVVLDPHTVAYLDLVGSGIETVSHVRENGRIVLMFCSFEGPPNILRLHGRGDVVEPGDAEWEELSAHFPAYGNARSIIRVRVTRISDSCGYGVPLFEYRGQRGQLAQWAEKRGPEGIAAYKRENNDASLDGLPGLRNT